MRNKEMNVVSKPRVVDIPSYWKKKRLSDSLVKRLKETTAKEVIKQDDFGEYKTGVFLHRNTVVEVNFEDDLWSLQIRCEHNLGLPLITEIRYKYLPNESMIVFPFPNRDLRFDSKKVILLEVPRNDK